jgi:hypothetical protein
LHAEEQMWMSAEIVDVAVTKEFTAKFSSTGAVEKSVV